MFKNFIAIIVSCMLVMTMPITVFAETAETGQEDQKVNEEMKDVQPDSLLRTPASNYPFEYMYPENLRSFSGGENVQKREEIISNGSGAGVGTVSRTYNTVQLHYSDEINLTIIQRGYLRSGLLVQAEGATIWGDPSETLEIDPTTGAVVEWRHTYKFSQIDPDISRLIIRMSGTPVQTSITDIYERIVIVNFDDGRGAPPENPAFAMSSINPDKYTLTGVDSTMEYRLKTSKVWTPCTDDEMLFDIPTKKTEYYIRYKAVDSQKESQVKEVSMYPVPGAPNVSYSQDTEKFSGLTKDMEISTNGSDFIPVTDEII